MLQTCLLSTLKLDTAFLALTTHFRPMPRNECRKLPFRWLFCTHCSEPQLSQTLNFLLFDIGSGLKMKLIAFEIRSTPAPFSASPLEGQTLQLVWLCVCNHTDIWLLDLDQTRYVIDGTCPSSSLLHHLFRIKTLGSSLSWLKHIGENLTGSNTDQSQEIWRRIGTHSFLIRESLSAINSDYPLKFSCMLSAYLFWILFERTYAVLKLYLSSAQAHYDVHEHLSRLSAKRWYRGGTKSPLLLHILFETFLRQLCVSNRCHSRVDRAQNSAS